MEQKFRDLIESGRAAATVKDEFGYCVFANRLTESLRGFAPGEMEGKHITELAGADPVLVWREFERFKEEGAWIGQYPTRNIDDSLVFFRSCNFIHFEPDGIRLYVSFNYPLDSHNGLDRDGPARLAQSGMTAQDVCVAQLYVDGFTDDEVAILLGVSPQDLHGQVGQLVERAGTLSKTAACIQVLKSRLVV